MDPVERIDEERPGCRVILCCKNDIYSAGIASILGAATGIDLVGQFDSETFSVHAITQLSPGVLIIDADVFPVSYAEAIIAEARRAGAGAVVLVSSIDVSMVTQVLKAGARGVLTQCHLASDFDDDRYFLVVPGSGCMIAGHGADWACGGAAERLDLRGGAGVLGAP